MSLSSPISDITLDGVYPWGRTLDEYAAMFSLTDDDLLRRRILSCADGPASFNAEVTARGGRVVSTDPLYRFPAADIRRRVEATHGVMVNMVIRDAHRFVFRHVADPQALGQLRLTAMNRFLADYQAGLADGRYLDQSLPRLDLPDDAFDIALCSHFLFLYSKPFDTAFHVDSIVEMSRLAPDVRIFPLLDTDGYVSRHVEPTVAALRERGLDAEIVTVDYELQAGGNQMLRVRRPGKRGVA